MRKQKKVLAILLATTMLFSSITVSAAEKKAEDKQDEIAVESVSGNDFVAEDVSPDIAVNEDSVELFTAVEAGGDNDSNVTAQQIVVNDLVTGICETSDDVDWYKFTTTETGYFTLQFGPAEGADANGIGYGWRITIYEGDAKTEVAYFEDIESQFISKQFPFKPNSTFYVCVRNNYSAAPASVDYSFRINNVANAYYEQEHNDTNITANTIQVNTDYIGNNYKTEDTDWYKFTTTKKGYFQLNFGPAAGADASGIGDGWNVIIYEADAKTEIISYSGIEAQMTSMLLPFAANTTFYVRVTNNYSYEPTSVNYSLRINNVANNYYEVEHNETNVAANTIEVNKTYRGNCYHSGDVDWFKFKITKKGYFTVTLSGDATNNVDLLGDGWHYRVYQESNLSNPIYEKKATNNNTSWKLAYKPGIYYIRVENDYSYAWTNGCIYNLKVSEVEDAAWEKEGNDTNSTATQITTGKNYYGLTNYSTDVDWYKVSIAKTGYFQVQLSNNSANASDAIYDGWDVYIYSADNLSESIAEARKVTGTYTPIEIPYPKGTYYIKVCPNYSYDAPTGCIYNLKVTETASSTWESENNDTSTTADSIKLYTTYTGYLKNGGDYDYYKISVPASGKLKITLKNVNNVEVGNGWNVILYNAKNMSSALSNFVVKSKSGNETVTVSKGTYYIAVRADYRYNWPGTNKYSLTTDFTYATPTLKSVAIDSSTSVKLTWEKDANVKGYEIYRSTSKNGTYKKIASISKNTTVSYVDKNLTTNKTYYYKIRTYGNINSKNRYSGYSSVKSIKVLPPKGSVTKVTAASKAFTVKWKTNSSVSGYEVQCSTSKTFKTGNKSKLITSKSTGSYKFTKLTAKKKYYVRVRAYKTISGKKVYGEWSAVKSITTK